MNKKIHKQLLSYFLFFVLPVTIIAQGSVTNLPMTGTKSKMLKHTKSMDHPQVPTDILQDSTWLHYDDVEMADSWGFLINGEEYDVVAKWDPADLSPYSGWAISKIKFIVVNSSPLLNLSVIVLEGPNATEIYNQPISNFNANVWTEIILDSAVSFNPNSELYVGYHVDFTGSELGGFVTATDDGPPIDEYGNLYRFDGAWYSDYNNHNLQVFIESTINAYFEADTTEVCYPHTIHYTDTSVNAVTWNWIFEGGNPATSTDQHPSVAYNAPGNFDVTLIISDGTDNDTLVKSNYISVSETPGQPNTPSGDTAACNLNYIVYTTDSVPYASDYNWLLDPTDAGTLTVDGRTATLQASATWTGDYTLEVQASNLCGDGVWSNSLECVLYPSLQIFNLNDGGEYCDGEAGVEITQDGSEVGVEYELFIDDETTGVIVVGDGSPFSYGFFTEDGSYTSTASNAGCSDYMGNTAYVIVLLLPESSDTPTGDTIVCAGETVDYQCDLEEGSDDILWVLTPETAGTIIGSGSDIQIEWNIDFDGEAQLSTQQSNQCGIGDLSNPLEIECFTSPTPEITGPAMVCDEMEEQYTADYNEGSEYAWTVEGGEILNGNGTHEINVMWGLPGNGTVNLEESKGGLCVGVAETLEVEIDECTGIDNAMENNLLVFPNPAQDYISIQAKSKISQVKIFNLAGKEIIKESVSGYSVELNTSEFEPGVYILVIVTEEKEIKKRIIIS